MPGPEQVENRQADDRARVLAALCGMGFGRREVVRALRQFGDCAENDSALLRRALDLLVPRTTAAPRV